MIRPGNVLGPARAGRSQQVTFQELAAEYEHCGQDRVSHERTMEVKGQLEALQVLKSQ